MPTILLVRHAQASFGGPDYDMLSELGNAQCAALAADLAERELNVNRVVSGSLVRQRASAAAVAERLETSVTIDARWNEYDVDDVLAHHSTTSARPAQLADSATPPVTTREFQQLLDPALLGWIAAGDESPANESWPGLLNRVTSALTDVTSALPSGTTGLVFTSGGPLAALSANLLGLPENGFVTLNRVLVNTGVTKVIHGRGGSTLVSFNEHAHLERIAPPLVTYR